MSHITFCKVSAVVQHDGLKAKGITMLTIQKRNKLADQCPMHANRPTVRAQGATLYLKIL